MANQRRRRPDKPYFRTGLTVSDRAWERYGLDEVLGAAAAEGAVPGLRVLRQVAARLNRDPDAPAPVHAGQLLAATLVEEVLRYLFDLYCDAYAQSLEEALQWVRRKEGTDAASRTVTNFVGFYPPERVRRDRVTVADYLAGAEGDTPHVHLVARELLLLCLTNENRAYRPLTPLFDDTELRAAAPYERIVGALETFYEDQPVFPGLNEKLLRLLRAPMTASPDSLDGQVDYIIRHWSGILPEELVARIRLARDVMREETAMRGLGPGPAEVLRFGPGMGRGADRDYPEPERFSLDKDWMSNVVLIAKSVYVWLDQLSRAYGQAITRLDQIPEEELDRLARWGFTGLWLIGLWERSPASQKIKQMMGNPEALSSAYSLYDYTVAEDLGGDEGYRVLHDRAARRGIRLASDMVPNHVGLYSKWVIEHPDWFIQSRDCPFPSYQFTGEDLSWDPRVLLQIEDGYWEHRDAAVVFRRVDKWTGDTRFMYHGNDGTSMPWNDTAQLNYLLPEVREAVIQTILHVARKFPIIRFDAAMTLAKKHYQRLWFPLPGEGGAIPSRAEHSMTREEFDAAFPEEFWRQVVDRVAEEVPDTLLLAEAFWLMEGYFVRTLGMHRVYNSAFMNMLKLEDNMKYRMTLKNVLEFSPEVLKRFVNFMNNPDEDTAVAQFGRGDKYFGVAVMMATMPGLPMFGHGQIEGFAEKYGMEYRRAYWHEEVDEHMVERHEREVFPLMRRRSLFSGADNFALFDFVRTDGSVDENVFAYTNRSGGERALILYNNAYPTTAGTVHTACAVNRGSAENKHLVRPQLMEALGLAVEPNRFVLFRDTRTGMEFIRESTDLASDGLFVNLEGYQYHAFLDFRDVYDTDGTWRRTADLLAGDGAASVAEERKVRVVLAPVLERLRRVLCGSVLTMAATDPPDLAFDSVGTVVREFLEEAGPLLPGQPEPETVETGMRALLAGFHRLPELASSKRLSKKLRACLDVHDRSAGDLAGARILLSWCLLAPLGTGAAPSEGETTPVLPEGDRAAALLAEDWRLDRVLFEAYRQLGATADDAARDAAMVELVTAFRGIVTFAPGDGLATALRALFKDRRARAFLGCNWYEGVEWFRKESYESLLRWCFIASVVGLLGDEKTTKTARNQAVRAQFKTLEALLDAARKAQYRVAQTVDYASETPA